MLNAIADQRYWVPLTYSNRQEDSLAEEDYEKQC